jgi:hypothetical protein
MGRGTIMFKQLKRKVTAMLVLLMIMAMLPLGALNFQKQAYASSTVKIGDYVQFGKYLNKPILWRVINLEADGTPLLFSEKILCLKPFDVSESGEAGAPGGKYSTDLLRQEFGSGKWENSNIREWLNSKDTKVTYTTQPPTKAAIYNGFNDYDTEPGFLSNFSEAERNMIKPVTRKFILAIVDKDEKDGGTVFQKTDYIISSCVTNYDNAYYKNLSDQVYLLDIKALHDYVYSRGWEYKKMPTKEAIEESGYKNSTELSNKKCWYYWSSTPGAEYSHYPRIITNEGSTNMTFAHYSGGGIVPAVNLKSGVITSGEGTIDNPYVLGAESNKTVFIIGGIALLTIVIGTGFVRKRKMKNMK